MHFGADTPHAEHAAIMHIEYRHLKWLSFIWDTELTTKAKVTAAVLSDHMNANHDIAWPSEDRIAKMSSQSKRTVVRAIQELEEGGWIIKEQGGINIGTNRYMAVFPKAIEEQLAMGSYPQARTQSPFTGATESLASATQSPARVPHSHPNQTNESNNKKVGDDKLSKQEKQAIQKQLDDLLAKQQARQ